MPVGKSCHVGTRDAVPFTCGDSSRSVLGGYALALTSACNSGAASGVHGFLVPMSEGFSGGIAAGGCEPHPHGFPQPLSCSCLVSWVLFPCVSFTRQHRFEIHPRCGGPHSVFLLVSVPWTDECFVLCSPVWDLLGNSAKMKSGNRRVKSQERGTIGNCSIVFCFLWHRGASPRVVCDPWGGWQPPHGLRAEPPVSRTLHCRGAKDCGCLFRNKRWSQ